MEELPIFESKRTPAGLWQQYLVFRDRIELRSIFGRYRIGFEKVESISVSPPLLKVMVSGKAKGTMREIKVDMADIVEHVCVRTTAGMIRSFRFTPDDPREFVYAAESAWRHFPKIRPDSPKVDSRPA